MLEVSGLYKQFGKQVVIKDLTYSFESGSKTVVLGANGSGKSTLLSLLCGATEPTAGSIIGTFDGRTVPQQQLGLYVGIATPAMALNPLFTLKETLEFHRHFCPFPSNFDLNEWLELAKLQAHTQKFLSGFSSGMLQRVRLILALANDRPVALLDEPTSNLDVPGVAFYHALIDAFAKDKTVIIGSNSVAQEYAFCTKELQLS